MFNDLNGDGQHSNSEPGIPNVKVSVQSKNKNLAQDSITDADGKTSFGGDLYCSQSDTLTVIVTPPDGYTATTPLTFGPYPVPNWSMTSVPVMTKTPLPSVIYVGLKPQ